MKLSTTKKLFVVIIAVMMFSAIPAVVNAQKICRAGLCPKGQTCVNGFCVKSGGNGGGPFCNCLIRPIPFECGQICGWAIPANRSLSISSVNSNAISFQLPQAQNVSAKIYDVTGRLVKTLANEKMRQGDQQIDWDRKDQAGKSVSPGIYILQVDRGAQLETKKIIVIS